MVYDCSGGAVALVAVVAAVVVGTADAAEAPGVDNALDPIAAPKMSISSRSDAADGLLVAAVVVPVVSSTPKEKSSSKSSSSDIVAWCWWGASSSGGEDDVLSLFRGPLYLT